MTAGLKRPLADVANANDANAHDDEWAANRAFKPQASRLHLIRQGSENKRMVRAPVTTSVGLGCITYVVIAITAFDSLLKPLFLATFWSNRLGAPYWGWIVVACFAIGSTALFLPRRLALMRAPVFVTVGLVGSLFCVGAYADHLRSKALREFDADRWKQQSFLRSVRVTPEFQSNLHAAAMKDCVAYGWSYRRMGFYKIPPKAAVNVLPLKWLKECPSIEGSFR